MLVIKVVSVKLKKKVVQTTSSEKQTTNLNFATHIKIEVLL